MPARPAARSTRSASPALHWQLRLRAKFRVRTLQGRELISPTTISQQRELSFNETVVLAKDAEQAALYQEMQSDIVQQILRRVGSIKSLTGQ